ncbi:MAG: hypothetical protein ALAOOOJD_02032 [bacterium]|nr:hypothetical protein [bacterium]
MSVLHDAVGLCQNCSHVRAIKNARGSTFYLCALAEKNPHFPRYPRLPVLACAGYVKQYEAVEPSQNKRDE